MEAIDSTGAKEKFCRKRTKISVQRAYKKLDERIFYYIHQCLKRDIENNKVTRDPEIWKLELKRAKKIEKKYGVGNLLYEDSFDFGMDCGKLLLLGWAFGKFDNLGI